jgi:hypothetical protein
MKSAGASAYAEIVASYLIKIAFQDEPTARSCSKIPIRRKPIFVLGEPGRLTPPPALISSGSRVWGLQTLACVLRSGATLALQINQPCITCGKPLLRSRKLGGDAAYFLLPSPIRSRNPRLFLLPRRGSEPTARFPRHIQS